MKLQESFADQFLNLIIKSKSGKSSTLLNRLLKLDPKLNKLLGDLEKNLNDTEKWAERERKSNPDFVAAEKELAKLKGN